MRRDGFAMPKGLVPVAGVPLARRTIEAFVACGITSVACIVNEESPELARYLADQDFGVPVHIVVRSTPSSMHSLFALAPLLRGGPFFLATVDAIYNRDDLAAYVRHCAEHADAQGVLAVTGLIDDEKPLYVRMGEGNRILAMGDAASGSGWVTGGLYFFRPEIFDEISTAQEQGLERLRNFQSLLVEKEYRVYGYPFGDVVDVDHRADVERAEALLEEWESKG